jgi:hypothetical protein
MASNVILRNKNVNLVRTDSDKKICFCLCMSVLVGYLCRGQRGLSLQTTSCHMNMIVYVERVLHKKGYKSNSME